MKEYKTINKKLDINKFPLQKLNIGNIQGKILYLTTTPSPNKKTFILTDKCSLYVVENNNFKKPKEYPLKSEILSKKTLNNKTIKFQTDTLESQIWTDKKGNHAIIKYKNVSFYYNPYMLNKVEELILIPPSNILVQPFAVVFNENELQNENTGVLLLSDFNSSIYELQLFLNEKKEIIRLRFGEILKLKPEVKKRKTVVEFDMKFFEMDKDDRIVELKILSQKNKILAIAITKRILFQFEAKKDFRGVLDNYDVENGSITKAVKKFFKKSRQNDIIKNREKKDITRTELEEREQVKYTRIQLIKNENGTELDSFGFMSDCGYITGKINENLKPQNKFNILKYYKISVENKEKAQIVHQKMPKAACESNFHKFFLYPDYLVVLSKLTNGIKHDEYLPYDFIDMFYDDDSIIIYNENGIYKISLENENKYLYEDYIEKGDYKKALDLAKDDKYLTPMIHKIYADHLFNKQQYLEAALEYAFSNEIFENVCIKFLNISNISALIRYFILLIKFRLYYPKNDDDKDSEKYKKANPREQFIDKYLLYTWLLELITEKNENQNNDILVKQIGKISRYERYGSKYLDSNLLYYLLNIFNKVEELIKFAGLKKDNETIITSLINRNKIDEALEQFKMCLCGDENEFDIKLKKYFYKYGNLFIRENLKSTIDLLSNYFRPEKPEELIRILISPNLKLISEKEEDFKRLIDYTKDLTRKTYKIGNREINITKSLILNNLYILLVSYGKTENYKITLFNDLKYIINSFASNIEYNKNGKITDKIYFDLNFSKKIFKAKKDQNSQKILCLIYYLLNQYIESIDIAIENDFQDLIKDLLKNIQNKKLKKKIWLRIFQHEKENKGLSKAKEVINKSKNIIQIEDVIPLMGDNEKLIELKDELNIYIENSEKSERKLNKEIKDFNESNDSINKDIESSEKKAIKKSYTELKCSKCDKNINSGKNTKFFLFPCQHIFDLQCLIDTYMEFNFLNLGDKKQKESFEDKISVIKDLLAKIKKMEMKKRKAMEGKEQFGNEEEYMLNHHKKILYNWLDDDCLLCGQEMIDSTQMEFSTDDKFEWELI